MRGWWVFLLFFFSPNERDNHFASFWIIFELVLVPHVGVVGEVQLR